MVRMRTQHTSHPPNPEPRTPRWSAWPPRCPSLTGQPLPCPPWSIARQRSCRHRGEEHGVERASPKDSGAHVTLGPHHDQGAGLDLLPEAHGGGGAPAQKPFPRELIGICFHWHSGIQLQSWVHFIFLIWTFYLNKILGKGKQYNPSQLKSPRHDWATWQVYNGKCKQK